MLGSEIGNTWRSIKEAYAKSDLEGKARILEQVQAKADTFLKTGGDVYSYSECFHTDSTAMDWLSVYVKEHAKDLIKIEKDWRGVYGGWQDISRIYRAFKGDRETQDWLANHVQEKGDVFLKTGEDIYSYFENFHTDSTAMNSLFEYVKAHAEDLIKIDRGWENISRIHLAFKEQTETQAWLAKHVQERALAFLNTGEDVHSYSKCFYSDPTAMNWLSDHVKAHAEGLIKIDEGWGNILSIYHAFNGDHETQAWLLGTISKSLDHKLTELKDAPVLAATLRGDAYEKYEFFWDGLRTFSNWASEGPVKELFSKYVQENAGQLLPPGDWISLGTFAHSFVTDQKVREWLFSYIQTHAKEYFPLDNKINNIDSINSFIGIFIIHLHKDGKIPQALPWLIDQVCAHMGKNDSLDLLSSEAQLDNFRYLWKQLPDAFAYFKELAGKYLKDWNDVTNFSKFLKVCYDKIPGAYPYLVNLLWEHRGSNDALDPLLNEDRLMQYVGLLYSGPQSERDTMPELLSNWDDVLKLVPICKKPESRKVLHDMLRRHIHTGDALDPAESEEKAGTFLGIFPDSVAAVFWTSLGYPSATAKPAGMPPPGKE
ncbi:MAG: hypothetical protein Q7V63_08920 [Gammaproteobacteria bacterium]|nr:hypothetical protein [Gammaproteobacteria bacterium]